MNEQEWFESIYGTHADYLFRLGRHLLGSDADEGTLYDLMQETFMDAWVKRRQLMEHPNVGGWLTLSIKNRAQAYQRKVNRRGMRHAFSLDEEEARPVSAGEMTPEQEALLRDRVAALSDLLGEENARLFLAYAVEGYTARELGQKWGLSEDCVWMRISRMKKKLVAHPEIFYAVLAMTLGLR